MPADGDNEGFRILDEYSCTAIPGPNVALPSTVGRGVNTGMGIVSEQNVPTASALEQERAATLRAMSIAELLALVQTAGAKMSGSELLAIHEIAAERLTNGSQLTEAIELSREAMRTAVRKSA